MSKNTNLTKIISLTNITKIYPGSKNKALDGVDLEINQGEFFSLVGRSGSGKSTVLKIIAGLELPTSGEVTAPESLGMVFQLGALFPWLTAIENVSFSPRMRNESVTKAIEKARDYLKMVGLTQFENKYPRELSGGQRQRVGIARALATETEVLLLDEPFSALDSVTANELHQDILKIWQETNKTIVLVSHSLEEAALLSDRVGVINKGKLVKVIDIDLKRPREISDPGFQSQLKKLVSVV